MKKILFITHDTSRTGAPLVVLNFMKWLKTNNSKLQIDCLTLSDGPLNKDFVSVSNNFFDLSEGSKSNKFINKALYKILGSSSKTVFEKRILEKIKKHQYDVIYGNTIVSLEWGSRIKDSTQNAKLILHLHELNKVIKLVSPNFLNYSPHVNTWICVSELVKKNIVDNYNVSPTSTTVIYPFSNLKNFTDNAVKDQNSSFIVGGSGLVTRRKGFDLYIAIAKEVKRQAPQLDIKFNWVGKIPNEYIELEIESELQKANLNATVNFSGEEINPMPKFNAFDLFLMTSKEDPFPLVCIEVASLGKPILCFEGATGTEEVFKNGGGKVIPYLSIYDMAKQVIEYAKNKDMLQLHGLEAKEKFKGFNVETQAPKIYDVLNLMLQDG